MQGGKQHIIKKILFGGILFLLCLPLIQQITQFKYEKPLAGAVQPKEYTPFTWENWFNESYQNTTSEYLNDHFGFRTYLVRLNNQKHYTLFNTARANGVVIGKESYLYEKNYIKAYNGTDFIGEQAILEKTKKLKAIQDTLSNKGVDIYVVFAPGKGSYCHEYIPDEFKVKGFKNANYFNFKKAFDAHQVNYLDFKAWFETMKPTTPYPLFAKAGIHWSKYGEFLAADSLVRKISAIRKVNMPKLILDTVIVEEENKEGDYDIGEGMNLLFDLPTFPMGYPKFHVESDSSAQQQKVLFIADSYYWGMFNLGFSQSLFGDGRFWYYNKAIYPDSYETPVKVQEIDMIKKVEENDVIILLSTDANLYQFAFGFIEELYDSYQH